jgi:hypothetical protein
MTEYTQWTLKHAPKPDDLVDWRNEVTVLSNGRMKNGTTKS